MASSSGNENNQNTVESANKSADGTIVPRERTFRGILDILEKQRDYVEPPYHGPQPNYSYGPKVKGNLVSDTDDPKAKGNVDDDRKRALEMHPEDENEELQVRKKSGLGANRTLRSWVTYKDPIITDRAAHIRKHQAGNLVPQKLEEEGLPEKQQSVQEEEESSSGNENNQNMVDSAKAADVKIIPYENTIDGVLDKLRSQLRYVEPVYGSTYYGPGPDYMVEDPVSDTDDPNVKSNVVGDHKKKSLPRAIDTKWGRIVHEYELELARTGEQGFLMPQNLEERLLQINHDEQKDQAGVLVPEAEGRGAREVAKCAVKLRALNIQGASL